MLPSPPMENCILGVATKMDAWAGQLHAHAKVERIVRSCSLTTKCVPGLSWIAPPILLRLDMSEDLEHSWEALVAACQGASLVERWVERPQLRTSFM
jgi:hypothetical protein